MIESLKSGKDLINKIATRPGGYEGRKDCAMSNVIFEDEYFEFVRTEGIGINDTPWTGLGVISKGLAKKHVVEIRLHQIGFPDYNGTPVEHQYNGVEVAHGMRSCIDTLDDTKEYIKVLQDAVEFTETINKWLLTNN